MVGREPVGGAVLAGDDGDRAWAAARSAQPGAHHGRRTPGRSCRLLG